MRQRRSGVTGAFFVIFNFVIDRVAQHSYNKNNRVAQCHKAA